MLKQELIGAMVTLRAFTEANLTKNYLGWLSDPQLMKFSNQRFRNHSIESCRAYMASFVGTDNMLIAIYREDAFVGTMTAYCSRVHRTCDMGLLIGADVQGQGLGKDAWSTLMTHMLDTGYRKVTGGTLRCNKAMVRIMTRCGMHVDGVRVGQELINGVPEDTIYFAKFAS